MEVQDQGAVWSTSGEGALSGCRLSTSHGNLPWQKEDQRAQLGLFYEGTNSLHEGSTFKT